MVRISQVKRMRIIRIFMILIAFLLGILLSSAITIIGAKPQRIYAYEFRLQRPAPYADAPYWSVDFIDEMKRCEAVTRLHDNGYWIADDFDGQWINFRDGFRVTTGQPENAPYTLHMFGNSLLMGREVPDEYTIASYLQRIVSSD